MVLAEACLRQAGLNMVEIGSDQGPRESREDFLVALGKKHGLSFSLQV